MVQPNVHLSSSRQVKQPFCGPSKAHSVVIEAFRNLKFHPAVLFKYDNETTIKNVNELEPNQSQHIPGCVDSTRSKLERHQTQPSPHIKRSMLSLLITNYSIKSIIKFLDLPSRIFRQATHKDLSASIFCFS